MALTLIYWLNVFYHEVRTRFARAPAGDRDKSHQTLKEPRETWQILKNIPTIVASLSWGQMSALKLYDWMSGKPFNLDQPEQLVEDDPVVSSRRIRKIYTQTPPRCSGCGEIGHKINRYTEY